MLGRGSEHEGGYVEVRDERRASEGVYAAGGCIGAWGSV